MIKSKESSDEWAVAVQNSVAAVQASVKHVQDVVASLQASDPAFSSVCKEVLSNPYAPVRTRGGIGTCCITGVRVDNCIDVAGRFQGGRAEAVLDRDKDATNRDEVCLVHCSR